MIWRFSTNSSISHSENRFVSKIIGSSREIGGEFVLYKYWLFSFILSPSQSASAIRLMVTSINLMNSLPLRTTQMNWSISSLMHGKYFGRSLWQPSRLAAALHHSSWLFWVYLFCLSTRVKTSIASQLTPKPYGDDHYTVHRSTLPSLLAEHIVSM